MSVNKSLSAYTDAELEEELYLRRLNRDAQKRIDYTPNDLEKAAAVKDHWAFYGPHLVEGPGDNGPYTLEVHGYWQNWLDNYRRNHE